MMRLGRPLGPSAFLCAYDVGHNTFHSFGTYGNRWAFVVLISALILVAYLLEILAGDVGYRPRCILLELLDLEQNSLLQSVYKI